MEGINNVHVIGAGGQTEAVTRLDGKTKFNNIIAGSDVVGRYTADANADLVLSNITLNDGYEAPHSITTGSNVNVTGTAELKAGTSITLGPGFLAEEGTTFTASIGEVPSTADRFYYLKDHLGSIKMMVDQNGEVKSYDDYYPFGMTMAGRSSVTIEPKYRFTGKEKSEATGHYLFGARTYNPLIGKWDQVDPMAVKYPGWSPYNYCVNNPLLVIDPNGEDWYIKKNSIGGYVWVDNNKEYAKKYGGSEDDAAKINVGLELKSVDDKEYGKRDYLSDGSIFFYNETKAYGFMWDRANLNGVENAGFLTSKGVLVTDDSHNDKTTSNIPSPVTENNRCNIIMKSGNYYALALIHTHQNRQGDPFPSQLEKTNDYIYSLQMGSKPNFVMGWNNHLYEAKRVRNRNGSLQDYITDYGKYNFHELKLFGK